MTISDCRHWIFDMDGTLTVAAHDFDAIRTALGIKIGTPILEAIDAMPEQQAAVKMQQLNDMEMEIAGSSKPQPGAHALLDHLRSQKCSVGILTRNGCDIALATLKAAGLLNYFKKESILGRESCTPKPDPAGITLHLKQWSAKTSETAMVGDYRFDLEAGFRAGVKTVHLDVDNAEQWPEITTLRVSGLQELTELLQPQTLQL